MNAKSGFVFEECVVKIFEAEEYSITRNVQQKTAGGVVEVDAIANKGSVKLCVEIKYSQIIDVAVERICDIAKDNNMVPVLVTAYKIEDKKRQIYTKRHTDLVLLDIANLLFAVKNNEELRNELVAGLSYTVEDIEPQEGFIKINSLQHDDYTKSLIEEMRLCETGRVEFRKYEELCRKLLENIFSEDLALWKEQQKSNCELYRFDLLCRIKDQNQKTFWSILERYFKSKYVVFEFKNYTDMVTQKEIYTTEKYLYSKALRSVGILIAAHGYDENAHWAAKGCLRENGKLIMLLETKDLIEMNKMKMDHEDPSNYLLEKLDEILLELEK